MARIKISSEWTMEERLRIISFITRQINFHAPIDPQSIEVINFLANQPADFLEDNRSTIFENMSNFY